MSYSKTEWVSNQTPLSADNMNHIEQGIFDNDTNKADKLGPIPSYIVNSNDNIYNFIHDNNLESKLFVVDINNFHKGVIGFAQFGQPGTPHLSFSFILSDDKYRFSGSNVEAENLTFSDALSNTYKRSYVFNDSLLPYVVASPSDTIADFCTTNDSINKVFIVQFMGSSYIGITMTTGNNNYVFEFKSIQGNVKYRGSVIGTTKFQNIFSATYVDNYEVTSNKVDTLSASSTNTQYPSAKLVYDQLALKANDDSVVHLDGNETISGPKKFTGNLTIGNDYSFYEDDNTFINLAYHGTDYIIHANPTTLYTAKDLLPMSTNAKDLGSSTYKWKDIYLNETLHLGSSDVWYSNGLTFNTLIKPNVNNTLDLGSSSYTWKNLYLSGIAYADKIRSKTNIFIGFDINFNNIDFYGSLFPHVNNNYNLGSSSNNWKDLYLGGLINKNSSNYGLAIPTTTSWSTNKTIATTDDISSYHDNTKEDISNKITSLSSSSTNTQYPSAKLVYDQLALKEDKSNKVTSITYSSTDTQYPSAKAVYNEVTEINKEFRKKCNTYTLDTTTLAPTSSTFNNAEYYDEYGNRLETYQDYVNYLDRVNLGTFFNEEFENYAESEKFTNNPPDAYILITLQRSNPKKLQIIGLEGTLHSSALNNGDIIHVMNDNIPDRWYFDYWFYAYKPILQDLSSYVEGPASSTENALAIYSDTSGKLLKNSAFTFGTTSSLSLNALQTSNRLISLKSNSADFRVGKVTSDSTRASIYGATLNPASTALDIGNSSNIFADLYMNGFIKDGRSNYGLIIPNTSTWSSNKNIALVEDLGNTCVTLSDDQEISGSKQFIGNFSIVNSNASFGLSDAIYIDGWTEISNSTIIFDSNSKMRLDGSSEYGVRLPDSSSWTADRTLATTDDIIGIGFGSPQTLSINSSSYTETSDLLSGRFYYFQYKSSSNGHGATSFGLIYLDTSVFIGGPVAITSAGREYNYNTTSYNIELQLYYNITSHKWSAKINNLSNSTSLSGTLSFFLAG